MNIEHFALAFAGLVLHYLFRWKEVVENNKVVNIGKELPTLIISIVTTTLLIYLEEDIKDLYPMTALTAMLLGYGNQSVFNKVFNAKKVKDES